jgi:hypothetical protein
VCTGLCWGNLRERDHWGDPGVDGTIIFRRIFRKGVLEVWTGLSWIRKSRAIQATDGNITRRMLLHVG